MKREAISLTEYQTSPPVPLEPPDLMLLESVPRDRLDIVPTTDPGWFRIRASSWVGTVDLSTVRVRITPKVDDLRNVLMMFASVAGIADWSPRRADYTGADFVEGVAELVLRAIDQATRRGLIHGYRTREDRSPVLRGRLLVSQLAARPWDAWPMPCRYDEFTADNPENRVLLAAVQAIRRWTVPPETRRRGSELLTRLDEVSDAGDPWLEAGLIRESPLNEHYRPALALSAIVLAGAGVAHREGDVRATSFLVDMNQLYERWIGAELAARLAPVTRVIEQESVALSRRPSVGMHPDLIFRSNGRNVLVGDVKYKLTGTGIARNSDYYQLLAYATALRLPRGILIYCQADGAKPQSVQVVGGGQELTCYPLGLGGDWSQIRQRLDALARVVSVLGSAPAAA